MLLESGRCNCSRGCHGTSYLDLHFANLLQSRPHNRWCNWGLAALVNFADHNGLGMILRPFPE